MVGGGGGYVELPLKMSRMVASLNGLGISSVVTYRMLIVTQAGVRDIQIYQRKTFCL